mgnify:FL=1
MQARLLAAQTAQEAYAVELTKLLNQVGKLEEQAVRRALALLTEARRRIVARLAEVPEGAFLASWLPRMQAEVERAMRGYADQYGRFLDAQAREMLGLAARTVGVPLEAAGLVLRMRGLDQNLRDILQGCRAGLIPGVADDAIRAMTTELQLGVLGAMSPFQLQRRVAEILRTQPNAAGVFGTVASRAEAITRTELNRVFNMASEASNRQLVQAAEQTFPEWRPRKRWLNSGDARVRPAHRRAELLAQRPLMDGGEFVLVDEKGQSHKARHPLDPRLPASLSVR